MKGRLFWVAPLAFAALAVWIMWPEDGGPAGPSISERVKLIGATPGLAAKIISDEDLPPEGTRSLFDHLIAQNEQLPYPFEKLVALISAQNPESQPPVSLMIPLGRSLLKAQADFEHPRVLVAGDFQAANTDAALGFAPRGQLFLGFVEDAAEIEVISYNEAAGRFEFQLVQDYRAGGVPRIVYARRAVCTTCHQNAAPIFPQRPWNETNGQPEIGAKIIEARKSEAPYLNLPVASTLAAPERFDELTDVGNFIPVTQRLWLNGCGEAGTACRRQMLKLALLYAANPGGFDAGGQAAQQLRSLQALTWPKDGIAVPESDIRNRDPLAEARGVSGFLRTFFTSAPSVAGARSNEDLSEFEKLPKLPADQDPLTPRAPRRALAASDLDGVFGLAQLLTLPDIKLLEAAANFETAKLASAADRLPDDFFAPKPFARAKTVNALLGALRQKPRQYAFLDTSEMSAPTALGVPPLALAEHSPLINFQQYCFACHRGNPAKRLDFMAGATEDEVLARIKDTAAIRDALDWERYRGTEKEGTLMPPADSHQRRELELALERGEPVLEEMRKVVPDLFDF